MAKQMLVGASLLLACCVHAETERSDAPPGKVQPEEDVAPAPVVISKYQGGDLPERVWPALDHEVLQMLEHKETFVLLYNSDACGASSRAWSQLNSYDGPWPLLVLSDHYNGMPSTSYSPPIEAILDNTQRGTPSLFFLRDGVVVDESHIVTNPGGLVRFVDRNSSRVVHANENLSNARSNHVSRRKGVLLYGVHPYANLAGLNVTGLAMQAKNFEGSDLRNASFKNARLEKINFSHTNLQGADFSGAELVKVYWGNSICPDGSRSMEHGYSCEDHLVPIRVVGIATDPAPDPLTEPNVKHNKMLFEIESIRNGTQ